MQKIIFIENVDQAKAYWQRREEFEEFFPICFTFPVEKFFLNKGIDFKTEDDYEKDGMYLGVYPKTLEILDSVFDDFKLEYRGIELMSLFHWETGFVVSQLKGYFRLLKEIIRQENPSKIIVFESGIFRRFRQEYVSKITRQIFRGDLKRVGYNFEESKEKGFVKAGGFLQQGISKIRLNNSKGKKIFFSGPKYLFESTFSLLLKNPKNKLFRCYDGLQKSFFVDGKYIPFYQFRGKESFEQRELVKGISNLRSKLKSLKFSVEEELEKSLNEWFEGILEHRIIEISNLINEMIWLIEKKKLDLLILHNTSGFFEKTFAKVAEKFGVPSIMFQHGLYGMTLGTLPIDSKYILVYGSESKKWFVKNNVLGVIELGCPRYDNFFKVVSPKSEKKILYAVEAGNSNIIVPGRDLSKKGQKETLKMLFRSLKKFPDYKLIIKTRDGWDMNDLPLKIAKEEGAENFEIIENADNLKLFNSVDMIIVPMTTIGMESVLLNKPTICVDTKNLDRINIYNNEKAIDVVFDEKELIETIEKNKKQEDGKRMERKKYSEKNFQGPDGLASERAANFIEKVLNAKKKVKSTVPRRYMG